MRIKILFLLSLFIIFACKSSKQEVSQATKSSPNVKVDFNNLERARDDNKNHTDDNPAQVIEVPKSKNSINCFDKETFDANHKVSCEDATNWVCGCNSVSYQNACLAKKAGIKSFKKGKCAVEASDI